MVQEQPVFVRRMMVLGIGPNQRVKASGIGSLPRVGWKMTRTNDSGPSASWKWPTLAGLPRRFLLELPLGSSQGAPICIACVTEMDKR
jgi:hypothetical protein